MELNANVETIWPAMAQACLMKNPKNRTINSAKVKQYANDMKNGKWMLNGETIVFDEHGNVLNGQHRLTAVVMANVPVQMLVVRNASSETFSTFDTGRNRRIEDVLSIEGHKNSKIMGTAARAFYTIENKSINVNGVANSTLLDVVQKNKSIIAWTNIYASKRPAIGTQIVGVIAAIEKYHCYEIADDFYQKAGLGIGLSPDDPEFMLRDKLLSTKFGTTISKRLELAYIIKTANARITGKFFKILRFSSEENTPVLIGV